LPTDRNLDVGTGVFEPSCVSSGALVNLVKESAGVSTSAVTRTLKAAAESALPPQCAPFLTGLGTGGKLGGSSDLYATSDAHSDVPSPLQNQLGLQSAVGVVSAVQGTSLPVSNAASAAARAAAAAWSASHCASALLPAEWLLDCQAAITQQHQQQWRWFLRIWRQQGKSGDNGAEWLSLIRDMEGGIESFPWRRPGAYAEWEGMQQDADDGNRSSSDGSDSHSSRNSGSSGSSGSTGNSSTSEACDDSGSGAGDISGDEGAGSGSSGSGGDEDDSDSVEEEQYESSPVPPTERFLAWQRRADRDVSPLSVVRRKQLQFLRTWRGQNLSNKDGAEWLALLRGMHGGKEHYPYKNPGAYVAWAQRRAAKLTPVQPAEKHELHVPEGLHPAVRSLQFQCFNPVELVVEIMLGPLFRDGSNLIRGAGGELFATDPGFQVNGEPGLGGLQTGRWLCESTTAAQQHVKKFGADTCVVCPVVAFLDGKNCTVFSSHQSSTPASLSVGLLTEEAMRSPAAKRLIGYFPCLDVSSKVAATVAYQNFKRNFYMDLWACVLRLLGESYDEGGFDLYMEVLDKTIRFLPLLLFVIADNPEACRIAAIKDSWKTDMPCRICVCPNEHMNDPIAQHPHRVQQEYIDRCCGTGDGGNESEGGGAGSGEGGCFALLANSTARCAGTAAARAFLKKHSLHHVCNEFWQAPMGVAPAGVYGMPYDVMHQFKLGTIHWCLVLSLELVEWRIGPTGLSDLDDMVRGVLGNRHNDPILPRDRFSNGILNFKRKLRPTLNASERAPALIMVLLCIDELLANELKEEEEEEEDEEEEDEEEEEKGPPPARSGVLAACRRCMYRVIQVWLYIQQDCFTKSSIAGIRKTVSRMLEDFQLAFGELASIQKESSSGFGWVKYHYNTHLIDQLEEFGSFKLASSDHWEAAHHLFVTLVFARTQRQPGSRDEQMAARVAVCRSIDILVEQFNLESGAHISDRNASGGCGGSSSSGSGSGSGTGVDSDSETGHGSGSGSGSDCGGGAGSGGGGGGTGGADQHTEGCRPVSSLSEEQGGALAAALHQQGISLADCTLYSTLKIGAGAGRLTVRAFADFRNGGPWRDSVLYQPSGGDSAAIARAECIVKAPGRGTWIFARRYASRYPHHDPVSLADGDLVQQLVWDRDDRDEADYVECNHTHVTCPDCLTCTGAPIFTLIPVAEGTIRGCWVAPRPARVAVAGLFVCVSSLHMHCDEAERTEPAGSDYYEYSTGADTGSPAELPGPEAFATEIMAAGFEGGDLAGLSGVGDGPGMESLPALRPEYEYVPKGEIDELLFFDDPTGKEPDGAALVALLAEGAARLCFRFGNYEEDDGWYVQHGAVRKLTPGKKRKHQIVGVEVMYHDGIKFEHSITGFEESVPDIWLAFYDHEGTDGESWAVVRRAQGAAQGAAAQAGGSARAGGGGAGSGAMPGGGKKRRHQ
jgi:hypothetical protein